MKILFASGGSGGHINPALAMAEIIQKKDPSARCCFAGRRDSMENAAAVREGYPFFEIDIEGLKRRLSCQAFRAAFKAFRAPKRAEKILYEEKIDLVIGTGGYVCYPFVKAAHALGIPSIVFEANAIPGLAFKLCERSADALLLQFDDCLRHLRSPEKARVIGAPLRSGFSEISRQRARTLLGIPPDAFLFLSFGGSLGAEKINTVCLEAMEALEKKHVLHIHACGTRYYDALKTKHGRYVQRKQLLPYLERMPLYMTAANLILCRAGAITLAELSRAGRAAITVPSPNVTADHQRKNAYAYREKGAALVLEEETLNAPDLIKTVCRLSTSPRELMALEKNIKAFDRPDAEKRFLQTVKALMSPK